MLARDNVEMERDGARPEARRKIHDKFRRESAYEYRSHRRLLCRGWVSITRIPAIDCALALFERDGGA